LMIPDGGQYRIFDISGRKILEGALQSQFSFSLSGNPGGIYILQPDGNGVIQPLRFTHQ